MIKASCRLLFTSLNKMLVEVSGFACSHKTLVEVKAWFRMFTSFLNKMLVKVL